MKRFFSAVVTAVLAGSSLLDGRVICLDFNGTSGSVSKMACAANLGFGALTAYMFFDGKNPAKLQDLYLEITDIASVCDFYRKHDKHLYNAYSKDFIGYVRENLEFLKAEIMRHEAFKALPQALLPTGAPMGYNFILWQMGAMTSGDMYKSALHVYDYYRSHKLFVSAREAKLVKRAIKQAFIPERLSDAMYAFDGMVELMQQCKGCYDVDGNENILCIASNMDTETFLFLTEADPLDDFFSLIKPEHRFASGVLRIAKPHAEFFGAILKAFEGVKPEHVILVDDQQENIDGAAACGMSTVFVAKTGDFKSIRAGLKELGVFGASRNLPAKST